MPTRACACLTALLLPAATLHAGVIYVNGAATGAETGTSWSDAFTDLQSALTAAAQGQGLEVWIAGGTYKTDPIGTDKTKSFDLSSGVILRGGFAGTEAATSERPSSGIETVLSGDLLSNDGEDYSTKVDNAIHVVTINGGAGTALHSLTIAGGFATVEKGGGGGVLITDAEAQLINCIVRENTAVLDASSGGGLLALSADIKAIGCTFQGNMATPDGGAVSLRGSKAILSQCLFSSNVADSGAGALLVASDAVAVVDDCAFYGNEAFQGAAIVVAQDLFSDALLVRRCRFFDNRAVIGGAIFVNSDAGPVPGTVPPVRVESCLFIANQALFTYGGAIYVYHGVVEVELCTFHANWAYVGGAAIATTGAAFLQVTNSILWASDSIDGDELKDHLYLTGYYPIEFSHTCIGNVSVADLDALGPGNTSQDPVFKNELGSDGVIGTNDEDLRLESGSPLVDAGLPDESGGTDLDGVPRWLDGDLDGFMQVDMGAYEFSNVQLALEETDESLALHLVGSPDLLGMMLIARESGEQISWPFGTLLIDPTYGFNRYFVGTLPASVEMSYSVLADVLGDATVTVQGLGVSVDGEVGNLTAAWQVTGNP